MTNFHAENLQTLSHVAFLANRLAKQLSGRDRALAYRIKSEALSALIVSGVATVNGHTISKDALRDRYAVDIWRLNKLKSRIRDEVQAGRMTKDQADQQIAFVDRGRYFAAFLLAGRRATPTLVDRARALLDTLRVARARTRR